MDLVLLLGATPYFCFVVIIISGLLFRQKLSNEYDQDLPFVSVVIAARNEELQATYWRGVELWRAGEGIGDALCHAGEHRQMLVAGYMAAQIESGPRDVDGVGFIAQWAVDLLILEMALTDQYGHGGCVDIDQCFGPCAERAASPMDHPCWMRPSKCLCRE